MQIFFYKNLIASTHLVTICKHICAPIAFAIKCTLADDTYLCLVQVCCLCTICACSCYIPAKVFKYRKTIRKTTISVLGSQGSLKLLLCCCISLVLSIAMPPSANSPQNSIKNRWINIGCRHLINRLLTNPHHTLSALLGLNHPLIALDQLGLALYLRNIQSLD